MQIAFCKGNHIWAEISSHVRSFEWFELESKGKQFGSATTNLEDMLALFYLQHVGQSVVEGVHGVVEGGVNLGKALPVLLYLFYGPNLHFCLLLHISLLQ